MNSSLTLNKKMNMSVNYKEVLIIIILAFYSVNLIGMGDFMPLLLLPYVFLLFIGTNFSKTFILSLLILSFFSLLYASMEFYYGFSAFSEMVGKFIYPPAFLILGYKLMGNHLNYDKTIRYLLIFIVFLSSYGVLSVFKTLILHGNMDNAILFYEGRLIVDLWSNHLLSATSLSSFLSLGLALFPVLFLSVRDKEISLFQKTLLLSVFTLSVFSVLQISSRTGILIIFTSIIVHLLFSEKLNKSKVKRIFYLLLVIIFANIFYRLNFFNIKTSIENSVIYQRLVQTDIRNDSRINTWGDALRGIFQNPLGGREADLNLNFAHNMWLDVGYYSGFFPFVILLVFTVIFFIELIKFLRHNHPIFVKTLVLAMTTAFLVVFMLEPVLQGLITYFTMFCFLFGVILKHNYHYDKLK